MAGNLEIGRRIKAKREALGLTQEKLAKVLGLNASAVAQWERGFTGVQMDNLIRLAVILRCKVSELTDDVSHDDTILKTSDLREIAMVDAFRKLPEQAQTNFRDLIFNAANAVDAEKGRRKKRRDKEV